MLRVVPQPGRSAHVRVPPSSRAIVSWNSAAHSGGIALTVHHTDGTVSGPLLYARWSPAERRSQNGAGAAASIAVDEVRSDVPFAAIGIASSAVLDAVSVSVPPPAAARAVPPTSRAGPLRVPQYSQYVRGHESERGWCSAAALAMLLGAWGVRARVPDVARAVYDDAYGGTGNWVFNAAYAGARGLRAMVAYLRGLDHAARFVAAGFPLALSIAWESGTLPGAPLDRSPGHLIVLTGIDGNDALVNDPAQPHIAVRYARAALDAAFRGHGGVAYLVAPAARDADLVALANGAHV